MRTEILTLCILIVVAIACKAEQPLEPRAAHERLQQRWQADQHGVWQLDWPAAPISGPVVFELWRSGPRYRYEILEAPTPSLVGQSLVSDGRQSWRYNRFDPPPRFDPTAAQLSPLTEAVQAIDRSLLTTPTSATQIEAQLGGRPAQQIALTYVSGDTLMVWHDVETGMPLKISLTRAGQTLELRARHSEPLKNPPDLLFTVGDWLR